MGARRDDMSISERMQIAAAALAPERTRGTITALARDHGVSRQTVYTLAATARQALRSSLVPLPHGPHPADAVIAIDRNRLQRAVVVLTEAGVSQRALTRCLAELLDTTRSPAGVNATLARLEQAARRVNAQWQPTGNELLAGDELFSHGQPNLLVVGSETLFIYALSRHPTRDGDTWGCVLLDAPTAPQCASDAGTGLAAGGAAAGVAVHQLDWDHLLRPLWGQVARLERGAYAALQAIVDRVAQFDRARGTNRLAQHLAAYERLEQAAATAITRYDTLVAWARQVDAWVRLIDLTTGQVQDATAGTVALQQLGVAMAGACGRAVAKVARMVRDEASRLFAYVPVLRAALAPLVGQWGAEAVQTLCRLWQRDADRQRHPLPWPERQANHQAWCADLDRAVALLGEAQLEAAWAAVSTVLGRAWRGSMLAECLNSWLRPRLDGRKQSDQGILELLRFLHNVHPFARGKRAHQSPAQAAGLDLPDDPLTLLGLEPKVSI